MESKLEDIVNNSEEARTLGAQLQVGHTLYRYLQRIYIRPKNEDSTSSSGPAAQANKHVEHVYHTLEETDQLQCAPKLL